MLLELLLFVLSELLLFVLSELLLFVLTELLLGISPAVFLLLTGVPFITRGVTAVFLAILILFLILISA